MNSQPQPHFSEYLHPSPFWSMASGVGCTPITDMPRPSEESETGFSQDLQDFFAFMQANMILSYVQGDPVLEIESSQMRIPPPNHISMEQVDVIPSSTPGVPCGSSHQNTQGKNGRKGGKKVHRRTLKKKVTSKSIACPESGCETRLSRTSDLNRHLSTVHGTAQVKCPFCPGTFSRGDALLRHERVSCNVKKRLLNLAPQTSTVCSDFAAIARFSGSSL